MPIGEKGRQRNLPHVHLQRAITASSQYVLKVAELWAKFKLFVSNLNLCIFSSINSTSCPKASGVPELKVRAQGSLNASAFLMHSALAATTEDCIAAYTGALSSVVWSTGAQLMIFFCFRFPVVLFGRPGVFICHATLCIC